MEKEGEKKNHWEKTVGMTLPCGCAVAHRGLQPGKSRPENKSKRRKGWEKILITIPTQTWLTPGCTSPRPCAGRGMRDAGGGGGAGGGTCAGPRRATPTLGDNNAAPGRPRRRRGSPPPLSLPLPPSLLPPPPTQPSPHGDGGSLRPAAALPLCLARRRGRRPAGGCRRGWRCSCSLARPQRRRWGGREGQSRCRPARRQPRERGAAPVMETALLIPPPPLQAGATRTCKVFYATRGRWMKCPSLVVGERM